MFETEADLQQLVHDNPDLILNGIPEINPAYCPDTPRFLLSLGREVPLSSGFVDNIFIDVNGIITLVECKRYSDSRIKREVYSQVIDYASNLQNSFVHYFGDEFIEQFYSLILKARTVKYQNFSSIVDALSEDPLLMGKNITDWKKQFYQRFEFNLKNGVFRIVILCVPSPKNSFAYTAIGNLMNIMTFVESTNSKYDIILLDLRHGSGNYQSQIIWRRYCQLPQIPLLALSSKNTALGIEAMKERFSRLPSDAKSSLESFLNSLDDAGIYSVENTLGYALYDVNTRKSMYISVEDIKDLGRLFDIR